MSLDNFVNNNINESGIWNKIASKLGSEKAMGAENLKNTIKKIKNDYKIYLGEQQIRFPVIEDVVEFLIYKVGMDINEDAMKSMAYGKDSDFNNDHIDNICKHITNMLHDGDPIDQDVLSDLINFLKAGGKDEAQVRYNLWKIVREYPGQSRKLGPLLKYVGSKSISSTMLNELFTRIAKMLLKNSSRNKRNPFDSTSSEKPRRGVEASNTSFKEKNNIIPVADYMTDCVNDLLKYGFDINELINVSKRFHSINDIPAQVSEIRKELDRFYVNDYQIIKSIRCLLSLLLSPRNINLVKPIIDYTANSSRPYGAFFYKFHQMINKDSIDKSELIKAIYNQIDPNSNTGDKPFELFLNLVAVSSNLNLGDI